MKIWLFEDDDDRYRQIKEHLVRSDVKVDIERYVSVVEEMNREGSPDLIVIDGTAICGHNIMPLGCMDMFHSNLRYFAEKHLSSHFIIYCAVIAWAREFAEELIEGLKDTVTIEVIDGDGIEVAKRICRFVPYEKNI